MRAVAALAFLAISLSIPAFGQTARKTSTFTNPDGAFRFVYPTDFQVCTKGNMQPCNYTYIPICDKDALVCVLYPAESFKGTNMGAAGFQVREIQRRNIPPTTADECVTPYPKVQGSYVPPWPEFLVSAEHPVEIIDGVSFLHGISGGAAGGHGSYVDLYRAFHNGICFELSTSSTGTNPNNSDPPMKTLSAAEEKRVSETISDIFHSFRFTK